MANRINMMISLLLSSYTFLVAVIKIPTLSAFATSTSNVTDYRSLLDFKNSIQTDPFRVLDSWNDSVHFCDWQGITCGKRHKRVTVLDVTSLNLVGSLSPSLGNLTFLRKMYLNENFFHCIIPLEIGNLFRLRILVLANNSFEGEIPANLSSCNHLHIIQLYGNKLSGRIPDQLSALSNLLQLALARNNFTGSIPPSLGNISTLLVLDLGRNNLTGNIPHEIGKLSGLQYLGLPENELSGFVPSGFFNSTLLTSLVLEGNHLTGQLPDALGLTLPNIKYFYINDNNFSGSIPSTLANASYLKILAYSRNMLTGPIPRNLGRLHQLQVLSGGGNPLGIHQDNDISIVIASLTNCTNLEALDLKDIQIGGILPLEISNLSRYLTYFNLYCNLISGSLPEGIGELVSLSYLNVGLNTFSGSIPHSIGKLINLKDLYLPYNNFIGEIPPSMGDISGLLILDLRQNMLDGSIPVSLSNLIELEALDLSMNRLKGSMKQLPFNSPIIELQLHQNKFTGSLPSEVGNLKQLVWLIISGNELSGEIPKSIGGCQMLEQLEMEGNFLNGTIPSSIGQLKSIEIMDLSRNKLSGEIPASLETLKFIKFINLSFNMLEGEVAINGVFSNASALSVVGNENLCGGIESVNLPPCPSKDSKKQGNLSTHVIIIIVICIITVLVLLLGCTYAIYQRRKHRKVPSSTSAKDKQLLRISYAKILKSTNGFSSENLIGEGKYGSVYRGDMKPGDKIVAIKVLKLRQTGAYKSFLTECEALRNIRHINLVKIITSCSSIDFKGNDFKALVLEYVPNGSLEDWLHQNPSRHGNEKDLDLFERLNISIDIATALDYLHNHSVNPIVHCDIKPSNVLLGDDLRGQVSDFGLAKFLTATKDISHDIERTSIAIRGTIGYVAPEYGMGGDVSTKGDI